MERRPTIIDIAKIAKVSNTAVSMALRGNSRIGLKTRQKILRIAKRLNYQPNIVARSLVVRRTNTIGLIITSILNPFYPELAKGIEDKAMELGYNIILCSTSYNLKLEKYFIQVLRGKGVDGIIFTSVEARDPNIKSLVDDQFPFILVNRRIHNRLLENKTDYITMNNFTGGFMAVEHLYNLGHRRIGIITGDLRTTTAIERLKGSKAFFQEKGLNHPEDLLIEASFSKERAYEAARRLMSLDHPPTAIFVQNDYMGLGVREAVLGMSLKIPEDVALIGFDNISASGLPGVDMTTISGKKYEIGSRAVECLVRRINGENFNRANHILLEPELIIRKSCGWSVKHGLAQTEAGSHSGEKS